MDDIGERIAGEIAMAESAGSAMKKWRELFGISQVELAKYLKISASTISDYEGNRRISPGVSIIKRFVRALLTLDEQKGSEVTRNLQKFNASKEETGSFYLIKDFSTPISGIDFSRLIEAKIAANPNLLDTVKLFGYTMLDSLKVILGNGSERLPETVRYNNRARVHLRPGKHGQVADGRGKGRADKAEARSHTERRHGRQARGEDSPDREDTAADHKAERRGAEGQAEQHIIAMSERNAAYPVQ